MSFWQLNKRMILTMSIFQMAICFFIVYKIVDHFDEGALIWAVSFTIVMFTFLFLISFLPGINASRVIRRLTEDTGEYSVLPLFDSGYTIGVQNEKSWFFFTKPCLQATISGLPVTICFEPSSRSSWSYINFVFTPLARDGSKRIYSTSVSFSLYVRKRLLKDVKPEVLKCAADAKAAGLISGAGRPISTVHFDAYE